MKDIQDIEKKNNMDESGLTDEDWALLRRIIRYIRSGGVVEEEQENIRRELIGMAKESRMRESSLKDVIGEDVKKFAEDILFASTGKQMGKGRKQVKGAGIFFIVYGAVAVWILGIMVVNSFLSAISYPEILENFRTMNIEKWDWWVIQEILFAIVSLAGGIWSVRRCGDRKRSKKQNIFGVVMVSYFSIRLILNLLFLLGIVFNIAVALEAVFSLFGILPLCGSITSCIYLAGVKKNKNEVK